MKMLIIPTVPGLIYPDGLHRFCEECIEKEHEFVHENLKRVDPMTREVTDEYQHYRAHKDGSVTKVMP